MDENIFFYFISKDMEWKIAEWMQTFPKLYYPNMKVYFSEVSTCLTDLISQLQHSKWGVFFFFPWITKETFHE